MVITKKVFLSVSIVTLIVVVTLISLRAYYVAIALVIGVLIMGHRELWSFMRERRMPPVDERVRENVGKSIRNGFVFLIVVLAFLMLPFSVRLTETPATVHILGGLFLSGGIAYLLSYLFYDRVEPKFNEKDLRLLKVFLLIAGISLGAFIISVFLHNAVYGLFIAWFGEDFWDRTGIVDEPVFFFIALLAVVAFAAGIIGSLVMFIKGLFSKTL